MQKTFEILNNINHPNNEPIAYRLYKLEDDYSIDIKINNDIYTIVTHKGFLYDGASVPRFAWTISGLTPDGLLRAAALVHDVFYVHKGVLDLKTKDVTVYKNGQLSTLTLTRKESDQLFKAILIKSHVTKFKANLAYHSVRIGGYYKWKT